LRLLFYGIAYIRNDQGYLWLQTAAGVQIGVYNAKVDRLTVLKTTFGETRNLLNLTMAKRSPAVITAVAFRLVTCLQYKHLGH
jgi:hypothetical protein